VINIQEKKEEKKDIGENFMELFINIVWAMVVFFSVAIITICIYVVSMAK